MDATRLLDFIRLIVWRFRRRCPTLARRRAVVGLPSPIGSNSSSTRWRRRRKAANLRRNPRIAFVIGGVHDGDVRTVAYEGIADEPSGAELERLRQAYYAVYPDGPDRLSWPGLIYMRVRPTWIRYSDYSVEPPQIVDVHHRRSWCCDHVTDHSARHATRLPTAVVRRRAGDRSCPLSCRHCCGLVWNFARAHGLKAGRHVALYLNGNIDLEVGVEWLAPSMEQGEVVRSSTPAGAVATAVTSVPISVSARHMTPFARGARPRPSTDRGELGDHTDIGSRVECQSIRDSD
jgi:hypothetical protein